jgi:hypothetical protein
MDIENKVIDLKYIEQSFGTELIPELLNLYIQQIPVFTEGIQNSFKSNDWDKLSRVLWNVRGTWALIGISKYIGMFSDFSLICNAFHLYMLECIKQERPLTESELRSSYILCKGFNGVSFDDDDIFTNGKILTEEFERFKNGSLLKVVPEYYELSLNILNKSKLEAEEILLKY